MDQTSADPTGLSLAGDKNTGDIALLQSNKTLYAGALFIDVHFRLRKHFLHYFKMVHSVLGGNKIMGCYIDREPNGCNPIYICFL